MAVFSKEKIRNIALIGHGGEGKTSLLEAMLYSTKAIDRLGKVDDGTTVSDYDAEEIARKMSISLSMSYVLYKDYKINVLDTPGFFDFEGEMVSALSVCDGAIVVTQASGGLSVGAEKALDYCMERKIPVILFINGLNKENSNFFTTVEAIKGKYGAKVTAIEFPIVDGTTVKGYVDVLGGKAFDVDGNETDIPANLADAIANDNAELTETAAMADEALMEKFFEEGDISKEDKINGIKSLVASGEFIPIVSGVATGKPVLFDLLDNIINLIPYAGEHTLPTAKRGEETVELAYDENAPAVCRVFKTIVDPFVGRLNLFKVYNGTVKTGDVLTNMRKDEQEKVSTLYILKGKTQEQVPVIKAGDIGAFAKLSLTKTGDTLCAADANVVFDPIDFPVPVLTLALSCDDKGGTDKLVDGLRKLMDEDRTFKVEKDENTMETVIRGMGETQIDILCKKVKAKYKVEAKLGEPRVAYRETIRKKVEQQGRCKKQNGGSGLFGDVWIRFEPAPDIDFEFAEEIVGGSVPKQYFPAVEKGLLEAKNTGVLAGCPMVGFRAVLYFGSYHPVDSKEAAFIEAAKIAFKEGIPKASPVLLEPIVNVTVIVPSSYMGDVMGDLTKRRGKVFGMESFKDMTKIVGEAPQSEMHRYAIDLRSMTQGRGRFSTEFARYDEVPAGNVEKICQEEMKKRAK
ncbi:MAG: elongation factor G [Christensenellales bacterium]